MRLKNKKTILHHLIPLFLLFFLAIPVYAQHGLTKTADASTLSTYNQDVPTMLGTVIGAAMSLVGVVFFVLSIYAGFLWMTARGDETQAKKARDTLTMSVIGLIIVFGAYAITRFVIPPTNQELLERGQGPINPETLRQIEAEESYCVAQGGQMTEYGCNADCVAQGGSMTEFGCTVDCEDQGGIRTPDGVCNL